MFDYLIREHVALICMYWISEMSGQAGRGYKWNVLAQVNNWFYLMCLYIEFITMRHELNYACLCFELHL